jgi:hypothetical protein
MDFKLGLPPLWHQRQHCLSSNGDTEASSKEVWRWLGSAKLAATWIQDGNIQSERLLRV